ncbi:MAG: dockerin type I repeat-containing protein, partial [Ruminococcus sp.]|nr:dockerin type I repeat-containing protein [Ruminococcus sp.]
GDSQSVFYIDLPDYVEYAMFNNYFDSGTDWTEPIYFDSAKTIMVYMLGYEEGESNLYPEGLDSFEDMIYVIKYNCDFELEPNNIWGGEWYYYYQNGCYGIVKGGNRADCIRQDHDHSNDIILGDVDGDEEVSIMDATEIQMVLAQIKPEFEDKTIADFDGDGEVSILDATAIQLKLAQIS